MPTTIAVTSIQGQQPPTDEVVALQIFLNPTDYVGVYDRLEIWRSTLSAAGPYDELTASSDAPAEIPKDAAAPSSLVGPLLPLSGKALNLLIDEATTLAINFASDLTYAAASDQVGLQGQHLVDAFVSAAGEFVVVSIGVGSLTRLRVVGGDAAPLLRLPTEEPGSLARGRDTRLALSETVSYRYVDWFGSRNYFYKTRFRNQTTDVTSDFSQPFSSGPELAVPATDVAVGELTILQPNGQPLINQEVRLSLISLRISSTGNLITGSDLIGTTDAKGHVEFLLARGTQFSVSMPGTSIFRKIQVPMDTTVQRFNLLDPAVGLEDDNFKVAVPHLVIAERRTL